jgi:type IV secretion system protein VirB9
MFKSPTFCCAALLVAAVTAHAQPTREVTYNPRAVIPVQAKLRFATMIILPDQEEILDFVCGDKDFWVVSGVKNLAYVKPAKAGAVTNLDLVTARGTVYSFLLKEGTDDPDLKVYVAPDATIRASLGAPPKFYAAAEVDALKQELVVARADASAAKAAVSGQTSDAIGHFRATYPMQLQFPYRFKANTKPFHVSAIFHDGRFTYIHARGRELPALYELRDNQPNLITFQVEHGVYIVPKVIERGYLAIGKEKLPFETATAGH